MKRFVNFLRRTEILLTIALTSILVCSLLSMSQSFAHLA